MLITRQWAKLLIDVLIGLVFRILVTVQRSRHYLISTPNLIARERVCGFWLRLQGKLHSRSHTASPANDPATGVCGCHTAWVKGTKYNPGDVVSVGVSASPVRKVSYECLSWPLSDYCAIFGPTEFGGNQGWKLKGSCDGEMSPTASPDFVTLTDLGGCPDPWSASSADSYTGGTLVLAPASEA